MMVWFILVAVLLVLSIGWIWGDMIDKTQDWDSDEPCGFWMTDED